MFGDRPEAPVVVLPDDRPETRWFAAVVDGCRGRYGAAYTRLDRLVREVSTPERVRARV